MEENDIIQQTLLYLDNWILEEDITSETTTMDYNKKVSRQEVLDYFNTATNYAISYTQNNDITGIDICNTALCLWTAGLLWSKYNQNISNNLDETNANPFGYGDKLVIQAKQILKPYMKYTLQTY